MLLSVVIPVLNEAEAIPLMLSRLRDTLREVMWEVIFVDDGSTDATLNILEHAALDDHRNATAVDADAAVADAAGITGTPAFVINGVLVTGAQSVAKFRRVIDRALAGRP